MSAQDYQVLKESSFIFVDKESREVLRITNEAKLIIGEGLSEDEATQKVANLLITAFDEQIQKMLDKRIASIKSELDRMNHNDTIATEDYLNYGPRNTTPRTDFIAHKGYTERTYICEMTELARILETELATMTARAEKAEDETLVWRNRFASILWSGALGKSTVRDFKKWEAEYKAEQNALTARAEKAEDDSKRLDWLESNKGIRWQQWNDILVELDRAAIDAAMKETNK
jgi:hypothetical protein